MNKKSIIIACVSLLATGYGFAESSETPSAQPGTAKTAAPASTTKTAAPAKTPEQMGFEIAEEGDRRGQGFVDSTNTMKMVLKDKAGNSSERDMRVKTLEGPDDDGDKTLIIFDTPRDQKGTALLTFTHAQGDDDQWLYLPALKRVKKISSSNKSGPFMGSEFSFEDMSGPEVDKYDYKWIRDETYNGQDVFVIESYPKDENSGYTKIVSWIDKENYRTLKSDYYDRKKSHLKTLTAKDFKLYKKKFWRPGSLVMVNLQNGKSTILVNEEIVFNTGLKDSDFNKNSLKRAR